MIVISTAICSSEHHASVQSLKLMNWNNVSTPSRKAVRTYKVKTVAQFVAFQNYFSAKTFMQQDSRKRLYSDLSFCGSFWRSSNSLKASADMSWAEITLYACKPAITGGTNCFLRAVLQCNKLMSSKGVTIDLVNWSPSGYCQHVNKSLNLFCLRRLGLL